MNNIKFTVVFLLILAYQSCSSLDGMSQEQEAQNLRQLFFEIENLVAQHTCVDASEWRFIKYGSKACGGPSGFIAYPLNMDTANFLKKIETYTVAEQNFNQKWNITGDCSFPPLPIGVKCDHGKPVLFY